MRPILNATLLGSLLLLAGCGIKGSLYLPDVPRYPDNEEITPEAPLADGDDSKSDESELQ